ncbi:MAG: lytic transglycosylase domain-containing protein [Aeromonas sp.]
MLAGHIVLLPQLGWSQSPPPAHVVFITDHPAPAPATPPLSEPLKPTNISQGNKQIHVYKSVQKNGVVRYSDMAPAQGHYELLRFNDCFACNPTSKVNWQTTGLFLDAYTSTIKAAATTYQVEPALIRALIHAESAFNPLAVSRKGAMGLTQLMPATAQELGVGNALLAEQNIFGGVKYLAGLLKQYDGDVALATAAYNAGPGAVKKHGGIPPYAETRAYVDRIKLLHRRYKEVLQAKGR